jgi:hypothetical protein
LLFVLFLVLFWAAVSRLHCPLAFFPQSDRCGFPLKHFRQPALARYLLVGPTIVAAAAPRCLCIRFRKHLTHTSFPDAVVPLCAAQPPRYA